LDYSTFTLTALQRNVTDSMRIFLDAIAHPLFTEAEVALARERRITALRAEQDSADRYVDRLALENEYGDHPYAANPLGSAETVKAATAKQLQELHGSAVNRTRLMLVVVGNVTRQQLESLLRPVVKDIPSKDDHPEQELPPIPNADRATSKLVTRDLPTVYVTGLFPAPNPRSEDYPAMAVGMNILSHRLFEEIRTKRNLSYAPFSGMRRSQRSVGMLYVTTPDPNAAITVMRDEVDKMRTTPISDTELKEGVQQMKTNMLMDTQASGDIAATLGEWELIGGGWQNFDVYLRKLGEVTPEQVRRAMDKYAHKVDFALLGKVAGVDQKLLESF
ncbi:MAG TPA: pitrilysin family protein, partial [Thermoanaerobaculia bacterium]|nr:pitrilysin family protein [Thermoanaerobaculia bacterium]